MGVQLLKMNSRLSSVNQLVSVESQLGSQELVAGAGKLTHSEKLAWNNKSQLAKPLKLHKACKY